jgi:hypothetical protein
MKSSDVRLRGLINRIVDGNPEQAVSLAKSVTRNITSLNQAKRVLYEQVKRSNFSNNSVAKLLSIHPDKHLFAVYADGIKNNQCESKDKEYNCTGCLAAAGMLMADGSQNDKATAKPNEPNEPNELIRSSNNIKFSKTLVISAVVLVGLATLISLTK